VAQKVLLLHGWGGSDYPHWQSHLAGEIAKNYGKVSFLRFSDVDNPKLDVWMKELQEELERFAPDVVVCHSLANTLWFHLCNTELLKSVKKLYLVAPPSMKCHIAELSEFFPLKTPSKLFAQEAILVTSTDDPYMSKAEAIELQKELNIPMKVLENAGHINSDSGFGEWSWMLKEFAL
jgi:hypothetical protein